MKTALATQAVCFNTIWINEGHGVCKPVPTLDWMGYLGLLTALQRDRSKLITGDCKSLFWLSADSFYKFVKTKRFRKLSEEGFFVALTFTAAEGQTNVLIITHYLRTTAQEA